MIEGFQALIDSGLVWQLQGSYGRTAIALIEQELCTLAEKKQGSALHNASPFRVTGIKRSGHYCERLDNPSATCRECEAS